MAKHIPTGQHKREFVTIKFSKSGVDQEWQLVFNKGRLITDAVSTNYSEPTYLRTTEKCKTVQDVLEFLYTYSYHKSYVQIIRVSNYDEVSSKNRNLLAIIGTKIDYSKVRGTLHWGRHTITFDNGYVHYVGNLMRVVDDGTYKLTGNRDLLVLTNKIIGGLASNSEFLLAVKRLEQ